MWGYLVKFVTSMARSKQIPQQQPKIGQILALSRYSNTSVMPNAAKYDEKLPIIPFFKEDGNDFMGTLTEMYNRSAMHKSCIRIKHVIACGDGVIINRKDGQPYVKNQRLEDFLAEVNEYGQSVDEVISRQLFDQILTQMHTARLTADAMLLEKQEQTDPDEYIVDKTTLSVTHEDISTARLGKPVDKKLKDVYLSYCWRDELKKYDAKKLGEFAEMIPLFTGEELKDSIIFSTAYETGRYYYAVPDYFTLEFKRWADISYAIPTYNHSRIENQFRPSGMVTFIGNPPEGKTPNDFADDVQDRFTGESNNSRLIVNLVQQAEQAPKVEIFDDAPEGIFNDLSRLSTESVLRGHQMHPAILMATAGSLGQDKELKTIFDLFYKNTIEGYQKAVLRTWDKILDYAGFGEYTLDIANNNPISLLGNIDLSNILSVNEIRTELGYPELADEQSDTKTLAELIGVGGLQALTAIVSDPNLNREAKAGLLSVAFNLTADQINAILPVQTTTI